MKYVLHTLEICKLVCLPPRLLPCLLTHTYIYTHTCTISPLSSPTPSLLPPLSSILPNSLLLSQELVRLSITLPHHDNYVPLVSSRQFQSSSSHLFLSLLTRPPDRDRHSCSNLVDSGPHKTSFLTPLPTASSPSSSSVRSPRSWLLYQHFNSTQCTWNFDLWLPLTVLTDATGCNAELTHDSETAHLALPLYYAYVRILPNGETQVFQPVPSANFARTMWSSGQNLSIPFDTYPLAGGNTYIYPITTQFRMTLRVIFYSVTESAGGISHAEVKGLLGNSSILRPLYSSYSSLHSSPALSPRAVRQAWQLDIPGKVETPVLLSMWPLCSNDCPPLSFSWFISTVDNCLLHHCQRTIAPQMDGVLEYTTSHNPSELSGILFFCSSQRMRVCEYERVCVYVRVLVWAYK